MGPLCNLDGRRPFLQGAFPLRVQLTLLLSTEHHSVQLRSHKTGTCMIIVFFKQEQGLHVLQTRWYSVWD